MSDVCRASIIINSYNYAPYLEQAINSALGQTYPHTEVVVVDDGSTDDSRSILTGYGGRVRAVLKDNGGQASAFNAGLRASRGEVIFFLDSDDALLPTAVARVVEFFLDPEVVKVHWPLWEIDVQGRETGTVWPFWGELAQGNVRDEVIRGGPLAYLWPPTTGNAWARRFLESILPMPEADYRTCPDLYLSTLVPLFGSIRRVLEPQGFWRCHGQNRSWSDPIKERLRVLLGRMDHCCDALAHWCRRKGLDVDVEAHRADWKSQPLLQWLHQTQRIKEEIAALVPAGDTLLLVEGRDPWGTEDIVAGRRAIPFMEKDGQYWGSPEDDATAIREVERLRQAGANFMVFGWQSFWWLDYYAGLHRHLRANYLCALENDRLVVFDLRSGADKGPKRPPAPHLTSPNDSAAWEQIYLTPVTSVKELSSPVARAVAELTCPGEVLLEAGCGSASVSAELATVGRRIELCDFSKAILDRAADLFRVSNLSPPRLSVCDLTKPLPWPDRALDVVWSSGVLEHWTDEELVPIVGEMARISRKCVISLVPYAGCVFYRLGKYLAEHSGQWPYGREIPRRTLRPLFQQAGLCNIREYTVWNEWGSPLLALTYPEMQRVVQEWWDALPDDDPVKDGQGYLLLTVGSRP